MLNMQSKQQQYFGMKNNSVKEATDIDELDSGTDRIENTQITIENSLFDPKTERIDG